MILSFFSGFYPYASFIHIRDCFPVLQSFLWVLIFSNQKKEVFQWGDDQLVKGYSYGPELEQLTLRLLMLGATVGSYLLVT